MNIRPISSRFIILTLIIFFLHSCRSKFDDKGRLLAENLTSSLGSLSFRPMMRSDSASVENFTPNTFSFKDETYSGAITQYNAQHKILFEGFLKNGRADSLWKFYYATGGVRMEGKYVNGMDVGLWRNYYGYSKPKIDKYYDEEGYMLLRIEYFDNGQVKNYQNTKCAMFGNKERSYSMNRKGDMLSIYVEDSVLILKKGQETELIGKNIFASRK